MTVKEFLDKNGDILISRITPAEFVDLTDGCVLFCVTTAVGTKSVMERTVKSAGYQMVVATSKTPFGNMHEIITLALTNHGYAKVDYIDINSIDDNGHKVIYKCKPLPRGDARSSNNWVIR